MFIEQEPKCLRKLINAPPLLSGKTFRVSMTGQSTEVLGGVLSSTKNPTGSTNILYVQRLYSAATKGFVALTQALLSLITSS
ncbi:hypothetical protein DSO57_1036225 [Entomophthora muscae]|uniref:Uncharacterized protein n=1 Tax=Entomophthora muscae TaxID=34485 RepID=A0ACC2TLF3_9FUNG|nr:hypothetical protein DSO57_1036225 [Entomophthora muscae]